MLAALLAPWLAPFDPTTGDLRNAYLLGPGGRYLLGTDAQGRDDANMALSQRRAESARQYLIAKGIDGERLAAKGYGALPSTFAALLSTHVTQVTLKNALSSYTDVATSRDYAWPLSALPPGVLTSFDLPDCYRELKKKNLTLVDPWGAEAG